MLQLLDTYELAGLIHDSVWQRNDVLTDEMLAASSLRQCLGHGTNLEQVHCNNLGNCKQDPIFETLSRGNDGRFYFNATPDEPYLGTLSMGRHVIMPLKGDRLAERFAQSLIVREFLHITEEL